MATSLTRAAALTRSKRAPNLEPPVATLARGLIDSDANIIGGPNATSPVITAAGKVPLTPEYQTISTSGAIALTLANGTYVGQSKVLAMTVDGGDATLTPANLQGGTTLTFNDVGDIVHLRWNGSKWGVQSNNGATLA